MYENTELISLLRKRNLKATSKRIEVLSILSNYGKAIPYSEIQNALQDFDRVTLYRTLNALMESGIIHKAMADGQETFYALCSNNCSSESHDHKHIHFKCTRCNEVSCVQTAHAIEVAVPGHTVNDLQIEASGICKSCNP